MGEDLLPVHLGDTEIVDGVLVGDSRRSGSQVALVAGAAVLAAAAVALAVINARRVAQAS